MPFSQVARRHIEVVRVPTLTLTPTPTLALALRLYIRNSNPNRISIGATREVFL